MATLIGNKFWKLTNPVGRPRTFPDAQALYERAKEYFDWIDRYPLYKTELIKHKGEGTEHEVSVGRPYTLQALTCYLNVSISYFHTAKKELEEKENRTTADEDLLGVIEWILSAIYAQQLEGASVGLYNAGIIARLNGLADNVNQNNTGDASFKVIVRDAETSANMDKLTDML